MSTADLGRALPWMSKGSCTRSDPDAWFPENGHTVTREAKRVCNGHKDTPTCEVRDTCLAHALANGERYGVWGGKSERERRKMLRLDPTLRSGGEHPCPRECGATFNTTQSASNHVGKAHPETIEKDAAA